MLKRIFVLLIKYIPVIQMAGMLLNNILYYNDTVYTICYILDYTIGNSIITTFLLYVCSYLFRFCNWHRLVITANFINITIANLDAIYNIPISDFKLLLSYITINIVFIFIALVYVFKR